ncbi:MAG: hypothetical protein PF495_14020 [Spirochaetales bacterium]|jgi:hypothetical protein|nr:hypothetical protein [Spirochaetales bacterium]
MKIQAPFHMFLLIAICVTMAACSSGQAFGPNITTTPTPEQMVKAGKWEATTDTLGSFVFNVSDDGTAITIVNFSFVEFSCGGFTTSGRGGSSNQNPSPIADGLFSISTTAAQMNFEINGEFGPSNTNASGSWRVVHEGKDYCTGEWEAKPQ